MSTAFTIVWAGNEVEREMREKRMRERVGRDSEGFAIVDYDYDYDYDNQLLNSSCRDDVCVFSWRLLALAGKVYVAVSYWMEWKCVDGIGPMFTAHLIFKKKKIGSIKILY